MATKVTAKKKSTTPRKKPKAKNKPLIPKEGSTIKDVLTALDDEAVRVFSDRGARGTVLETIPTGLDVFDRYVSGCQGQDGTWGLPVGRASELFSVESAGKTSFVLQALAYCQRLGGVAVLAETENALDPKWAVDQFGLNLDELVLIETDTIEDTGDKIIRFLSRLPKSIGPVLVAWDSIAATPTRAEVEGLLDLEGGKTRPGERARALGVLCRQLARVLPAHRAHMLFVNQVREKIGVVFGDPTVTPGGYPVKFFASQRFRLLSGGKMVKDKHGDTIAKPVNIKAVKNKLAPPYREALIRLNFESGWDDGWATLAHAMERDIIPARSVGAAAYKAAMAGLGWVEEV